MRQELSEVEIVKGIYEHTDQQIKRLNDSITKLDKQLNEFKEKKLPVEAVSKELFAQYPNIQSLSLSRGAFVQTGNAVETEQIVAIITSDASIDTVLHDRIERWLKVRLNNENVVVVNQSTETEKAAE
jgi:predicted nuclease with TOPRIM domain